jgi:hypothetical protein
MAKEKTAAKNVSRLPHEIISMMAKEKSAAGRVKVLQENATFGIKTLLQMNFMKTLNFDLPEGSPPYNEDEGAAGQQVRPFDKAIQEIQYCTTFSKLPKLKKEMIFIRILETLHKDDAKILILAKDKKLSKEYSFITESTVRKAFPNLLPEVKE